MLTTAKKDLRKNVKSVLSNLKADKLRSQSLHVCKTLLDTEEFKAAKSVGVYMNMMSMEIQTDIIIEACFVQNKQLYLPRCYFQKKEGRKNNYMSMIQVPSLEVVKNLKPQGKYKLLEPTVGFDILSTSGIDLLIMPGLAFSKSGERLGHGAGFYDEFLEVYRSHFSRVPHLVGLALLEQIIDRIPCEKHDWNLDSIIVGNEHIRCKPTEISLD